MYSIVLLYLFWVDRGMLSDLKARGAFFTPKPIAHFLANWAIRSARDRVLEPSCGDAVFLESAGRRLALIAEANASAEHKLHGIELHGASARRARERLTELGQQAIIENRNFFDVKVDERYDVVLGNPPFIRYQSFAGDDRAKALRAALEQGVPLKRLSSAWAAFLIHASSFLTSSGRLGFVLPAELLATHYASEVRSFLLQRFGSLKIVLFEELVFPGVLEEVILLLAEGSGGCNSFEVIQAKNAECLSTSILRGKGYRPPSPKHKWTASLLQQEAQEILTSLADSKFFERLGDWGNTYLGAVTGNNNFFMLNEEQRIANRIPMTDVVKICPPGARKLESTVFTESGWRRMRDRGDSVYLFYPSSSEPKGASKKYVSLGQQKKIYVGYKCSNRTPWWRVPILEQPDLILTYMIHHMPRLIYNEAKSQISNSVYGVQLTRNRKTLGRKILPTLFSNSISALSSEIEGRAYGGGLLKIEPREADQILAPSLSLAADLASTIDNFSNRDMSAVDAAISKAGAISKDAMKIIQTARNALFDRRMARNKSA